MSLNDRNGLAVAMTLVALLLALSIPTTVIGAEIVSPADGSVIRSPAIDLRYLAWAVPCDVTINDVTMQLPTCVNVTFEAIVGTNTLTVSDGISSDTATFTYLPNESELEPGIAPIRTLTPQSGNRKTVLPGFTIRGETSYAFSSVKIDGIELVGSVSADLRSSSGHRRIEIQPIAGRIRRITLEGVGLPQAIDLGLEEIPEGLSIDGRQSADAYAIDPTAIDFVNGTITKVAVGNTLWKCAQWEFSNRTCLGDWVYADRLQPGQQYEVLFDTVDPAYAETFDPDPALDLDIVALDNTTLVIAYVDSGSNHVSFEIWTTSGIRLVDETDVDTTGDANSRVALDVLNSSKFVIGFIDSPLDDAMFARYDRNGTQIQAPTQIDANAGTISDVDVCQIGDRFMEPWADSNDGDANYEIWSDAGVQTFNENQVDIAITPGAQGQDLVSCSAMNSTYFAYAFYDDADNDATVAAVLSSGTIAVAELDIDNNVGETGQVAVAGLRPDRFAMVFYDSTDDDITITVRNTTGAGFTTILANTDIDTNAGTDSRVAITEISNNGASEFVVAWNDNETGAIVAAVYNNAGTQVTAPFNITDQGNPANKLIDLAGYNSNLNTGICNSTFAIAYTNGSGTSVFKTFYRNGTSWDGICGAKPTLASTDLPANVVLNAGSTKVIACNISIDDLDGAVDIIEANATLYYHRNASLAQDHPSARYSNDSCAVIGTGTVQKNFTCSFEIQYFAPNGTWYCEMKARDGVGMFVLARPNLTIDPLYALNVTNTSLDFGSLVNGQVSSNLTENVTNVGNMRINITALGYGTVLGDGNAFACSGLNMSVDTVRFAPNATATYAQKERLNWSYKQLRISIARQDALGSPPDNISYWQAQVPANFTGQGLCNGTIVFQAEDGGQ